MLARVRSGTIIASLIWTLFISTACSESVHTKQVPTKTLDLLKKEFMMSEVLGITKMKGDLESVTAYFNANPKRYNYGGSQKQGDMNVEGYSVIDLSSPVIGYSLFFHRTSDSLVIVDTSVNPLNKEAVQNIMRLIKESFDSVTAGEASKLYFLGIYDLGGGTLLKVMVRETKTSIGPDYAIRYAISSK
jgi:hypothetical protein